MYHGTPRADAAALERQLRVLALTFDDGLRSNVEVAYPILRKLGVSATFFVCPGLIERGAWLWNHEARERLRTLTPPALAELAEHVGAPNELEPFVEWMKTLDLAARERVEQAIRAATPHFKPSDAQRDEFDLAGWQE